ncbi:MAG: hypothetical protein ACTH8P_16735 [Ewingella sp.]|uniref:hypothetical protein n=1 Tax=Ewingella sp. TaxID=1897459 RepID=UPI003F8E8ADD
MEKDKEKNNLISDLIIGCACDIETAEGVLNLLIDSFGEDICWINERSALHLVVMHIKQVRTNLNKIESEHF